MKIVETEKKLCECCMEVHDVQRVLIKENNVFKSVSIDYEAEYFYCGRADEIYADEEMIKVNDIAMKNAYRRTCGLLTTDEIIAIRRKYGIGQSDLCLLLGWGGKTITRYEGHQVQDNAHDTILRKLADDPEWFLTLLKSVKDSLSPAAYSKYQKAGVQLYERDHDLYLRRAIFSKYACFLNAPEITGNRKLSLDIVVDMIRYFADSSLVTSLYKVKLMKMLWYSDALSYKRRQYAMTGMAYQALPMGAVPIAHDFIIDLSGIHYEEIEIGDGTAYQFLPTRDKEYPHLAPDDIEILNVIIQRFGMASKDEIVSAMHKEEAYIKTAPRDIIQFKHAENLSLE
ncbi:MAG: DUF4065 domain-containing protein [Roseburia sp.]|nr:DUF4065 domain-containing protein [Roseburia sp.]MCM1243488.1 DUF4065 domain-containing protein [Roseburia sp.]